MENKNFIISVKLVAILVVAVLIVFLVFRLSSSPVFSNIGPDDSVYNLDGNISVVGPKGNFYIDKDGRKINDQVYYWNTTFIGNYALVSYKNAKDTYHIIDKTGKIVKTIKDTGNQFLASVVNEVWVLDGILYDKNLNRISDENKVLIPKNETFLNYKTKDEKEYGLLDKTGKVILKRNFPFEVNRSIDPAEDTYLKNRYCILNSTATIHSEIINCKTGKIIIESDKDRYRYTDKGVFYYNTGVRSAIYYLISDDKVILSEKAEMHYMYDGFVSYIDQGSLETTYYNLKSKKKLSTEYWIKNVIPFSTAQAVRHFIISGSDIYIKKDKILSDISNLRLPSEELSDYIEKKTGKRILLFSDSDGFFHIYDLIAKKDIIVLDEKYTTNRASESFKTPFLYFRGSDGSGLYYNLITNKKLELLNSSYDYTSYNSIILTLENGEEVTYNANFKPVYTLSDADNSDGSSYIPVIDDISEIPSYNQDGYNRLTVITTMISLLSLVGMIQIFRKANRKWFEALVPGYNLYIFFKIAEIPVINILFMFIPILNIYVLYSLTRNLLIKFGKSTSLTIPALILMPITFMYLGFSKLEYKEETRIIEPAEVKIEPSAEYAFEKNEVKVEPTMEYVSDETEILNFEDIIKPAVSTNTTVSSPEFKNCPKCGTKIKSTEQACFMCGAKF